MSQGGAKAAVWEKIAEKNAVWPTSKRRKEHDLAHEQPQKRARFGPRRNAEMSTVWCAKKTLKRARFGARRNAEKSTIWRTTKRRKEHDLAHDDTQKRARFGARRYAEKSTISRTTKHRKEHDLAHDETQKRARFGARFPIDQVRQFSAEKVIPYLRQKNNY